MLCHRQCTQVCQGSSGQHQRMICIQNLFKRLFSYICVYIHIYIQNILSCIILHFCGCVNSQKFLTTSLLQITVCFASKSCFQWKQSLSLKFGEILACRFCYIECICWWVHIHTDIHCNMHHAYWMSILQMSMKYKNAYRDEGQVCQLAQINRLITKFITCVYV